MKTQAQEIPLPGQASKPTGLRVDDVRALRAFMTSGGRGERFQALHRPDARRVGLNLLETWALILGAWALCFHGSLYWTPVALLLMGSRQRALGNLLHDASHGNMLEGRALNARVCMALCALPMFEDYERYRLQHLRHHASLGQPGQDPDYLELPPPTPGQPAPGAWAVFTRFFFDARMWRSSMLATLPQVGVARRLQVLGWWLGLLGLLSLAAGPRGAAVFALLWLGARASVYHAVKVFAEISDHVGLVPGTTVGYTRNLPSNWLSFFMHPHHDNYHLTHHLFPRIPLAHLPQVHRMLMAVDLYTQASHCESYFLGEDSVVRSWIHPKPEPVRIHAVSP